MEIKVYEDSLKHQWNDFLKNAKNYHFFFDRDFISYHGDRFEDFSLMIYEKNKLIALLPANRDGDVLYSHQGLTYGGFIVNDNSKMVKMIEIFENIREFLKESGIKKVYYKTIPYFHHLKPAEEDLYALYLQGAKLVKREVGAVIDLGKKIKYSNGRKWSLKKSAKEGFVIEKSEDFKRFWALLEEVLKQNHDSKPTHSLEEIETLHKRFPKNIELFLLFKDEKLLCGAVTFVNPEVCHLQYVANSKEGRVLGALDFLIDNLIKNEYKDKKYFDFGTSSEDNERFLNEGLIDQKERFGARCVVNDRYLWEI